MKGSIIRRGRGWRIGYYTSKRDLKTGDKIRVWETVYGSKSEAQRRLREALSQLDKGLYVKPTKLTVGQWLDEWLNSHAAALSPRTRVSYEMIVRQHLKPALGHILLPELEPRHLEAFYAKHQADGRVDGKGALSPTTVRYCHSLLRESLAHAVRLGVLGRNVAEVASPPRKARRTMIALSVDDVHRFLSAASESPLYPFFATLVYTGTRRGEALALRWSNLDLDSMTLTVVESAFKLNGQWHFKEPKTASGKRGIDLPPRLVLLLKHYKETEENRRLMLGGALTENDLVFSYPDGRPLDPSSASHSFKKIARRAGLPHLRLHDLRHGHATIMLQSGVDAKTLADRLGHSSVRTTLDVYCHPTSSLQKEAAQRFEDFLEKGGPRENGAKVVPTDVQKRVGVVGFEPTTT